MAVGKAGERETDGHVPFSVVNACPGDAYSPASPNFLGVLKNSITSWGLGVQIHDWGGGGRGAYFISQPPPGKWKEGEVPMAS